jgi:pimeloyl-ACP methyl ester carboxylesterase
MKTIKLSARGITLAYEEVGTGLPVVLLHAFPFDREMWSSQFGPLSAGGFRVLAPDFPGFGQSTAGSGAFTVEGAADVIAEFVEGLGLERVVLGGLSMGGYVAMAFARKHPRRLAGLILADTKPAPDDDAGKANRDALIATVRAEGAAKVGATLLGKVLGEKAKAVAPVFEFAKKIATRQTDAAVVAALGALRDRPDAAPGLESVRVPTLVLVGEFDTVTPPLAAARMGALVRGSDLIHIPGAGHLSNLENPDAFNQAVLGFLKKVK